MDMPIMSVLPTGDASNSSTGKQTINDEHDSHIESKSSSEPFIRTVRMSVEANINNSSPNKDDSHNIQVNHKGLNSNTSLKTPDSIDSENDHAHLSKNLSEDENEEEIKTDLFFEIETETETVTVKNNMEDDGKSNEVDGNETTVTRVYPSNYTPPVKTDEMTQMRPKRKFSQLEVKEEDSLLLKHPSSLAKFKKIDDNNEKEFLDECNEYLERLSMFKCRKAREKKTILDCRCLKDIYSHEMTLTKVKSLILAHTRRPKGLQGLFIKDWIRMAGVVKSLRPRGQKKKPCFPLLGVYKEGRKDKPFLVCSNGFCNVLGIGSSRWERLKNRIDSYEEEIHGLSGKEPNRKMDNELARALNAYFEARIKEAEPRKGKNHKFRYRLPSTTSKRKEYQRFCWSRGWKAKATNTGDYGPLKDFQVRQEYDENWLEGTEPKLICSWSKFKDYWSVHFPELFINTGNEFI